MSAYAPCENTLDCCLPSPFSYQITTAETASDRIMGEGDELISGEGDETLPGQTQT